MGFSKGSITYSNQSRKNGKGLVVTPNIVSRNTEILLLTVALWGGKIKFER